MCSLCAADAQAGHNQNYAPALQQRSERTWGITVPLAEDRRTGAIGSLSGVGLFLRPNTEYCGSFLNTHPEYGLYLA